MEYKTYLARKRLKKLVICGHVNIPYGTAVTNEGGVLMWNGKPVCATTSQDAFDFFSQNDDGRGRERGELVSAILIKLAKQDQQKERWGRGKIPFAESISARNMKISGFGIMTSTMRRLRICAIS